MAKQGWKITVGLVEGVYGTPQPQIEIVAPRGTHHRTVRVLMYMLAAAAEAATPADRSWNVNTVVDHDVVARVCIEVMDGDPAELEAARITLTQAKVRACASAKVRA